MPEYLSNKKRKQSIGINSYSEYTDTTKIIGNVLVGFGSIGVGTTIPTEDVDVNTIRVRDTLYDYTNSGGVFGYYLVKDTDGIKWVAVPPIDSNAIFVAENNNIVGVSSFTGINIISDELIGVSTNPINSNFADIRIVPRWLKSGETGIYTTKNVGIGTTIPTTDFQVGFGTTGVTIDGSVGVVSALGYYGNYAFIDQITVNDQLNVVGLGSTLVAAFLGSGGGITTTGGDLYVGGSLFADRLDIENLEVVNINATGITTLNVGIVSTFRVTGVSTLGVTSTADLFVDANLEVTGITTLGITSTADLFVDANLEVAGISTFVGFSTFNNSVVIQDNLLVSGLSTFVGVGTFSGDLYVSDILYADVVTGLTSTTDLLVDGNLRVTGISTLGVTTTTNLTSQQLNVSGITTLGITSTTNLTSRQLNVSGITTLGITSTTNLTSQQLNVSGVTTLGVTTISQLYVSGVSTFSDRITGIISTATKLENQRTFEITGDVVASPIFFDGTGNVSFAATIQPNSVGLGTDTFGDYLNSISGTIGQIIVTGGTGEGSTPVISFDPNPTIGGNVIIGNNLQVTNNLNVDGNITIGGTSATLNTETLTVTDAQILLGVTTSSNLSDISTDLTANTGGIAIASTEGTPLVNLTVVGIDTLPATYKRFVWVSAGTFAGLGTDAWLSNYAIGIGSTQFPAGTRLAVGSVQFTENDLAVVRNINSSGVSTLGVTSTTNLTSQQLNVSGITTLGITSTTNLTTRQLNVSGITTLGVTSTTNLTSQQLRVTGITTLGVTTISQLYVSGVSTFVGVGTFIDNLYVGKVLYANVVSGLTSTTDLLVDGNLRVTGITTLGITSTTNLTTRQLNVSGILTASRIVGTSLSISGISTIANFLMTPVGTGATVGGIGVTYYGDGSQLTKISSSSGYADTAGIATNVIGGIASVTSLDVSGITTLRSIVGTSLSISGISTLGVTSTTNLTSQQLNVSGITTLGVTTISQLYVSGVSTFVGVGTFSGNLYVGGDLYVADDLVFDEFTARNIIVTGISTLNVGIVSTLTVSGISTLGVTSATNLTSQQLNVTGITTLASIVGTSLSITGISTIANFLMTPVGTGATVGGIGVTYYGDGSQLTKISSSSGYADTAGIATYATSAGISTYADTAGISTYATNAGIATYATSAGIATYATSAGISTYATSAGIATYATSAGIATYADTAGISTYATNAGIATYADTAGISTYATSAGIATYADTAGISTYATNAGIATYATSAGIATYATSAGIATHIKGGAAGNVVYQSAPDTTTFVSNGVDSQVLLFNGSTPYWGYVGSAGGTVGYANRAGIATYADTAGIATYATNAGIATYADTAGISTYADNAGIATNIKGGVTGNIPYQSNTDTTTFVDNSSATPTQVLRWNGSAPVWGDISAGSIVGVVTYADRAGIATNVIGGIASVTSLDVSGITTLRSIVGTSLSISGISTIANFLMTPVGTGATVGGIGVTYYGDGSGLTNINLSSVVGVVTYAERAGIATNVIGGIASVSQLNVSGITTLASIVGTSLSITGISTIANFRITNVGTGATVGGVGVLTYYGDGSGLTNINLSSVVGVVTYAERAGIATNVIGGIASVTSLNVTGITTLASIVGTSLSITGISTLGITSTTNLTSQQLNVSGISTLGVTSTTNLTSQQLLVTGITTLTSIVGTSLSITGISTIANFRITNVGTGATVGGVGVLTYYGDGSGLTNINLSSVVGVVTYAERAGIATNVIGGIASVTQLNVSGITTLGITSISQLNVSGITTLTSIVGTSLSISGISTLGITSTTNLTSQQLNVTGITTLTSIVGTSLSITGISTLGITSTTNLTSQQLNVTGITTLASIVGTSLSISGISTIANFRITNVGTGATVGGIGVTYYGDGSGLTNINLSSVVGVVTYAERAGIATNVIGGIASVSQLNVTGITTLASIVGTSLSISGISTLGITSTTNLTSQQLNVSGITTLASIVGTSLSITGISTIANFRITNVGTGATVGGVGVLTYYGDGSYLTGVSAFSVQQQDITSSPVYPTFASNIGTSSLGIAATELVYIPASGNLGIGTTTPTSKLTVQGDVLVSGVVTATQFVTGVSGSAIGINTNTISGPATITIDPAAVGDNTGSVRIKGDLYVDGTQFIVNSTTIELADLIVGIATTVGTNLLLDGGGIGIGSANILKTITWNNSASALTSSEDWNLVTGKQYEINGTSVLSSTTLGSGVVNSSLTSVGTLGQLQVTGLSTFTNGPVLIGAITQTGTASQPLQVTGGAFVSGSVGIGTTTPTSKLTVQGDVLVSGILTAAHIVGTSLSISGISTIGNFLMTPVGTGATVGGIGVTYYGDGSNLDGVVGGLGGIGTAGGTVGTGITFLDFRGSGISSITVSSGIATITIPGASRSVNSYLVTEEGQTSFAATYSVGYADVYLNGSKLSSPEDITSVSPPEYTASNGTSIELTQGASAGDIVEIVSYFINIVDTNISPVMMGMIF